LTELVGKAGQQSLNQYLKLLEFVAELLWCTLSQHNDLDANVVHLTVPNSGLQQATCPVMGLYAGDAGPAGLMSTVMAQSVIYQLPFCVTALYSYSTSGQSSCRLV